MLSSRNVDDNDDLGMDRMQEIDLVDEYRNK